MKERIVSAKEHDSLNQKVTRQFFTGTVFGVHENFMSKNN